MSTTEGQNGSGPSAEGLDLAALHASLRCGRSLPVRHLAELDEAFEQRYYLRDVMVLCGVEVAAPDPDEPDPDVDDLGCPGCRDCVRYCAECVRAAARFGADDDPSRMGTAR